MYKYSKLLIKELISRATDFSNKTMLRKILYYFCKLLLAAQPVFGTKALYKVPGNVLAKY